MTFNIICDGPGPHQPANGLLGQSDVPVTGMRCSAPACQATTSPSLVNQATITQRAQAALATNTTYLAIPTPSNAQIAAQVQALTKECSALIRLLLGLLDSTAGT